MGYDDGRIACTDHELVIRRYYFPRGDRHLPYDMILHVDRRRLGRYKRWGSPDLRHWFNRDHGRPDKVVALVLDLGRRIHPVITPDHPDQVMAELAEHGVPGALVPQEGHTLWPELL